MNRRSWKNYWVRSDVQLPILAANLLFLAASAVVLIAILLSPLYHDLQFAEDPWIRHICGNLFLILLGRIALAMLLILGLATLHQVVMIHRLCGPLVNFGHTFRLMARANFSRPVILRKKDFLHGEALLVNQILDRLNADGRLFKAHLDQMKKSTEALMQSQHGSQIEKHLPQILQSVEACCVALNSWTVVSEIDAPAPATPAPHPPAPANPGTDR
jgi:hypothetical protein